MSTLLIDTSGTYSTVALAAKDEGVLGICTLKCRPGAQIHEQIRTLLRHADVTLSGVDSIGVITGPGSWTGLNIGVTAAKTLALILDKPLIPISALDALMAPRRWSLGRLCAVMNAGQNRCYNAWYTQNELGQPDLKSGQLTVTSIQTFTDALILEQGTPLVVEYGSKLNAHWARCADAIHHKSEARLRPEGIWAAAQAAPLLRGDEIMALSPTYLQAALTERGAST